MPARESPAQAFAGLPQGRRLASRAISLSALPTWHSIAVFLVLISLPLSGLILGFDRSFVLEENRILATRPELKLDRRALGAFPARFEAYFNDQFGFRKRLIYWLALVKVQGLGVTSTPGVTLGQKRLAVPRERRGRVVVPGDPALHSPRSSKSTGRSSRPGATGWLARDPLSSWSSHRTKTRSIRNSCRRAYNKVNPRSRLDQLVDHMKVAFERTDHRRPG